MIKITKKDNKAWVTFTLASDASIESAMLSGAWNEWQSEPMKQKKNGEFYLTKILPIDSSFEFGYIINNGEWRVEEELDSVRSPEFDSKNSLLVL